MTTSEHAIVVWDTSDKDDCKVMFAFPAFGDKQDCLITLTNIATTLGKIAKHDCAVSLINNYGTIIAKLEVCPIVQKAR